MNKNKLFLFTFAATTRFYVNLVGSLMLAEILAFITLPFINIKQLLKQYKQLRVIIGGLTFLLVAQMVSDLMNQSAPADFLRGWAVIIFAIISTIYLVNYLYKNPNNVIYYLFALFLVRLIFGEGELDMSLTETDTNYFKIRFMGFLNPMVMLISYFLFSKSKKRSASLVFIIYGLFCISMDARSNSLIFLISGLLLYLKVARIKITRIKIIFFGILLSVILYAGYVFYVNQVLYNNFGGTNARTQLYAISNPYNPFELLMRGRGEFLVLFQAGMDKPLFGHGSWGKDPGGKYARLSALLADTSIISDKNYIHAHSIIMGYWAYAGIFGLVAISFLFYKTIIIFLKIYKTSTLNTLHVILFPLSLGMFWSFLFSPIGHMRIEFPLFASLLIIERMRLNTQNTDKT